MHVIGASSAPEITGVAVNPTASAQEIDTFLVLAPLPATTLAQAAPAANTRATREMPRCAAPMATHTRHLAPNAQARSVGLERKSRQLTHPVSTSMSAHAIWTRAIVQRHVRIPTAPTSVRVQLALFSIPIPISTPLHLGRPATQLSDDASNSLCLAMSTPRVLPLEST